MILSRSNDPVPMATRIQMVQLRIWQKGAEYIDQVPSQTSSP
jgi:hypothetical protein